MKITLIIPTLRQGGAERVASVLSREWAKCHDVRVLVFDLTAAEFSAGGHVVDLHHAADPRYFVKAKRFIERALSIWRAERNSPSDIVVALMESAGFPAVLAALIGGWRSRLIVSVRDNPVHFSRLTRWAMRVFYALPFAVVVPSEGLAGAVIRSCGLHRRRVVTVPNPVLIERQGAAVSPCPEPYLLSVCRLERSKKGLDVLVAAHSMMEKEMPLLICGDGPDRAAIAADVAASARSGRVRLCGAVPDPVRYYSNAALFVFPSRFEGRPNALIEAMAAGCLVVSADCDFGPRELLTGALAELLVPVGNVAALAKKVDEVLCWSDDKKRVTRLALQNAVAGYSAPLVADSWLSLIPDRSPFGGGAGGAC